MRLFRLLAVAVPVLACDGDVMPLATGVGDASAIDAGDTSNDSTGTGGDGEISYADPPGDAGPIAIADAGSVTFTIKNHTSVPLQLPGGMAGRWLEIGESGYSLWPANSVMDGTLCDADPEELGELPPPGGEIPVDGEFSFDWKANAFMGAQPIPGMSEEYFCANAGAVPLGRHQFLICARQGDVMCHPENDDSFEFPPRLICASMEAIVVPGHNVAEFTFDENDFPTENCPQAVEIHKAE
jgi:hypothetical protein